jgi:uncharacterized membrane protein
MVSSSWQSLNPLSNTDKIIKLQYGNRRIFNNKLNSRVISKVLGFFGWVLRVSNTKGLDL